MGRLANARSDHITRWVIPTASRLLIRAASKGTDTRPLAEVAHIEMGQSPRGESYNKSGEGVPFIGGPADLGLTFPNTKRWTSAPTKLSEPGDIIVCVRATIGEPRWADGVYCLGRGVAGIRPTSKELDSQFLFRIVQASEQKLREQGSGTTFKTISKKHIAAIPVPVIPLETQEAISAFLEWLEHSNDERPNFAEAPPLPEFLYEQRRIVARIEELAVKVEAARALQQQAAEEVQNLVMSIHVDFSQSRVVSLGDILRLDEDKDEVLYGKQYPQVGIKSFGKGLFAKEALDASQTSYKAFNRLYEGAVVLSQVKGWEGAVAVCGADLAGFYVSPEYRTFRCIPGMAIPEYLAELVVTPWFYSRLEDATRGVGARRQRTRPELFLNLELPMPEIEQQRRAVPVFANARAIQQHQAATAAAFDALLPSILDRAFKGEL